MKKKGIINGIAILFSLICFILIVNYSSTFFGFQFSDSNVTTTPLETPFHTPLQTPLQAPKNTTLSTPNPVTPIPAEDIPALSIINHESIDEVTMETYFYQSKISDELYTRILNKSYKKDCKIPLKDLRYIKVLHYGFDNETHIGELVVNEAIADTVIKIFKELYEAKYPIEKMALIDDYDADDEASMEDNNSSCFNYRVIDGTTKLSKHSQGIAIDINPLYNPYVRPGEGERSILPVNGAIYADRTLACPYYIGINDICYQTFTKYGFTWGGNWTSSKDYQHFQISLD
jgi:hypothetical protein